MLIRIRLPARLSTGGLSDFAHRNIVRLRLGGAYFPRIETTISRDQISPCRWVVGCGSDCESLAVRISGPLFLRKRLHICELELWAKTRHE